MMDFTEFQRIVKDYSNLGAELLEKERVELTAELGRIKLFFRSSFYSIKIFENFDPQIKRKKS